MAVFQSNFLARSTRIETKSAAASRTLFCSDAGGRFEVRCRTIAGLFSVAVWEHGESRNAVYLTMICKLFKYDGAGKRNTRPLREPDSGDDVDVGCWKFSRDTPTPCSLRDRVGGVRSLTFLYDKQKSHQNLGYLSGAKPEGRLMLLG